MTTFAEEVRNHINMWGMSESDFGRLSTGNGSFAVELLRGNVSPTLRTVAKVQAWMWMDSQNRFKTEVDWLQKITGWSDAEIGMKAINNPTIITKLRSGSPPSLKRIATVRAFIRRELTAAGQPDSLHMPAGGRVSSRAAS